MKIECLIINNIPCKVLDSTDTNLFVIKCSTGKPSLPFWSEKRKFCKTVLDIPITQNLTDKEKALCQKRYSVISSVLPDIKNSKARAKQIKHAEELFGISRDTIVRYLSAYLITGVKEGLIPYRKERELTKDQKNFRWALWKYYYKSDCLTLRDVWRKMLAEKYMENGTLKDTYPSYSRFAHYYYQTRKLSNEIISRKGQSEFKRNYRLLIGDGVQSKMPIGSMMVDSTLMDFYVYRKNSPLPERPVLALAVDGNCGFIYGYYVGFDAGVGGLFKMLQCVVTDKQTLCRSMNIPINCNKWPNQNKMPHIVYSDKGKEYTSNEFDRVLGELGILHCDVDAFRADMKGPVERAIGVLQSKLRPAMLRHGYVEKDENPQRRDYKSGAILTVDELEKMVVSTILFMNSHRIPTRNYSEQETEKVLVYPCELWSYHSETDCKENFISVSEEHMYILTLERGVGRFTRHGVIFAGLHYFNNLYREEMITASGECVVAFDKENMNSIYIVETNGEYIKLNLIETMYLEHTLEQIRDIQAKQQKIIKSKQHEILEEEIVLQKNLTDYVNAAVYKSKLKLLKGE